MPSLRINNVALLFLLAACANVVLAIVHQISIPAHGMLWPDTLAYAGNTERVSPFMFWLMGTVRALSSTAELPFGRFLWVNYTFLVAALSVFSTAVAVALLRETWQRAGLVLLISWLGFGHSYNLLFVQSLLTESISTTLPILLLAFILGLYGIELRRPATRTVEGKVLAVALFLGSLLLFGIRAGNLYFLIWGVSFSVLCGSYVFWRSSTGKKQRPSIFSYGHLLIPAAVIAAAFLIAQLTTAVIKPEAKPLYGTTFLPNIAHLSTGLSSTDPCVSFVLGAGQRTRAQRDVAVSDGRAQLLAYNVKNINQFHREVEDYAGAKFSEHSKNYLNCSASATRLIVKNEPLSVAWAGIEQYLAVIFSRPVLYTDKYDQELLERWYSAPLEGRIVRNAERWDVKYAVSTLPISGQVSRGDSALVNWSWRAPSISVAGIHLVYWIQLIALFTALFSAVRGAATWVDFAVFGIITLTHSSLLFYSVVSGFIERYQLFSDYWTYMSALPFVGYVLRRLFSAFLLVKRKVT